MPNRTIAPLLAPALLAAVAAGAQTTDTATAATTSGGKKKAIADPNKKICRTVDTTGSIMMGTRVCHTKAEWASIDQVNSDRVAAGRDMNGGMGGQQGGGGFGR